MPPKRFTFRKQETDFYCGPAAVQMILETKGVELSQEELARRLGTTAERGTRITAIVSFLESFGFAVARKNGAELADVEQALDSGATVLVGYKEPVQLIPHYALIATIDATHVYFYDPEHGIDHSLARERFLELWEDDEIEAYGSRMLLAVST